MTPFWCNLFRGYICRAVFVLHLYLSLLDSIHLYFCCKDHVALPLVLWCVCKGFHIQVSGNWGSWRSLMNQRDNEVLIDSLAMSGYLSPGDGGSHFDTHAERSLRFYRTKSGQVPPTVLSTYDQIWGFFNGWIFFIDSSDQELLNSPEG